VFKKNGVHKYNLAKRMPDQQFNYQEQYYNTQSAEQVLPILFGLYKPKSLLDVGCGNGSWMVAARKFGITDDSALLSDEDIQRLIEKYVEAAAIAEEVRADFVDLKHCHGYLLHEFLAAHTRTGQYGGSFENRTRILREIISGIRRTGNNIDIGVRLSAFDFVPFRPDPALSQPGKLGPGIPEDFSHCLPYRYGFGVNADNPVEYELTETFAFLNLCAVRLLEPLAEARSTVMPTANVKYCAAQPAFGAGGSFFRSRHARAWSLNAQLANSRTRSIIARATLSRSTASAPFWFAARTNTVE